MPIIFSDHAEQQLARRKIAKGIVLETVKRSKKIIASFRGRKL